MSYTDPNTFTLEPVSPFVPGVDFLNSQHIHKVSARAVRQTTPGNARPAQTVAPAGTTLPAIRPFVKWVGGKRQLLDILTSAMPNSMTGRYFEPFIGGGALLFSQQPANATISDINPELVNCYQVIKDDLEALIRSLSRHKNTEEHFYAVRAKRLSTMTPVQRASRFIYLNKTCFNGLYRENKSGQFNAPYGRYDNPKIVDRENLLNIHRYLSENDIEILHSGYQHVLENAKAGDFIYLDPPYAPMSSTANFASYTKSGFGLKDQQELASAVAELTRRGVKVMQSNSNTDLIRSLYKQFNIQTVYATRAINCKGDRRGKEANEVLITNY
ncbi:DNA adenine methylase [Thauera sp. Sel9]|uniref:DNA adenine methylase n=1 Tax=Thauera sp. Sel9 TaxID=2974299 RepID=UPI0021E199DC|nr:DNA adenine methylase [Thauera sp. Sel9]MCV2216107.1 DNA adenine methylase [Thauera sp. Sel9]